MGYEVLVSVNIDLECLRSRTSGVVLILEGLISVLVSDGKVLVLDVEAKTPSLQPKGQDTSLVKSKEGQQH